MAVNQAKKGRARKKEKKIFFFCLLFTADHPDRPPPPTPKIQKLQNIFVGTSLRGRRAHNIHMFRWHYSQLGDLPSARHFYTFQHKYPAFL